MKRFLVTMITLAAVAYGSVEFAKQIDTSGITAARRHREELLNNAGE